MNENDLKQEQQKSNIDQPVVKSCKTKLAELWINVKDKLPTESGRYLAVITEQKDLGLSSYVWNVAFNYHKTNGCCWTDEGEVINVSYWMELPEIPSV